MHHAIRLLLGLAALTAAGAACAHVGTHAHTHPHLGPELVLVAMVGATLGGLYSMRILKGPFARQRVRILYAGGAVMMALVAGGLLLAA